MAKSIMALLIISLITISAWLGIKYLFKKDNFPIKRIVMLNKLQEQDNQQLQKLISESIDGGFFSLNIENLRQKIETLAWIETVSVRKKWPHTLQLQIQEKKVAGRWIASASNRKTINKLIEEKWDKKSLISDKGIVFRATLTTVQNKKYNNLEIYSSPDDLSVSSLTKCRHFAKMMSEVKLKIKRCFQDQRRSWFVELENDLKLFLGRDNNKNEINNVKNKISLRVATFIMAYKKILQKYEKRIDRIDMRYTNGFAIKWKAVAIHG
jgi:cell division protein FtsQ